MKVRIVFTLLAVFAWMGAGHAKAAEARVEPLPALIQASSWESSSDPKAELQIDQWTGSVAARVAPGKTAPVRMMLKTPVAVPQWADGLTFILGNNGESVRGGFELKLLVKDSANRDFYFYTRSHLFTGRHRAEYFPNHFRGRPLRLSAPALKDLKMGLNCDPVEKGRQPKPPFRITGFQLDRLGEVSQSVLYLRDFAFTKLSPDATAMHYSVNGQEGFAELDPLPSVTLGELWTGPWDHYAVSWEIRDRYDGQPFVTGGEAFKLDSKAPQYSLAFGRKIEFPLREKGSYWVRIKRKAGRTADSVPEKIDEWDLRVDIFKGGEARPHAPVAAGARVPQSLIRVAPERQSLIFKANEPVSMNVAYELPEAKAQGYSVRVRLRSANGSEVLKSLEAPLEKLPGKVTFEASEVPPGCYVVHAELLGDGKVLDESEVLIGRAGPLAPLTADGKPGPTGKELLASGKSLFYFDPVTNEKEPEGRWNAFKNFLDQAPAVCSITDFQIDWRRVEKMPGVYDWTEIDRFLAYAQEKKMTVLLWPQFCGFEPEWVPPYFERNRKGDRSVFGANMYSFHGAIVNYWHAEPVRESLKRFVSALATRYGKHPAVHGFYILTEHPGDHPSFNWFVGGSPETQADFRSVMRGRFPNIADINARWGTHFTAWEQVGPPPEDASQRYLLDWLECMSGSIRGLVMDLAKTVRKAAPDRLIMLYMGLSEDSELREVNNMGGIMFADGGSHRPETFGSDAMRMAYYGINRRTEPSSVTLWSDTSPYKLDDSLYTLMLGGGVNANCKMFISASKNFADLRQPPYSLDRFERFIPIWSELRQTRPMPRDAFLLSDRNAALLEGKSTKSGGADVWTSMWIMESGILAPACPLETALGGKLLVLPPVGAYDSRALTEITRFVENGGTLVMRAGTGRYSPDLPSEDWILLKRFGFQPPQPWTERGVPPAVTLAGDVFPAASGSFTLRDPWCAAEDASASVIAQFNGAGRVAVSWKPFGKGRVVVIWAENIVPALLSQGYPFLRDIGRWAGVRQNAASDSPEIWTNLLRYNNGKNYYGLVYRASDHTKKPVINDHSALAAATRWFVPGGKYRIKELISGADLGTRTAAELGAQGIPAKFEQGEVVIYRLEAVRSGKSSK